MPVSTRELYFQLGMAADDDGVVEAWNVMKLTNAHEDDLRILVGKGYITILDNEDLVAYLNDWETNNVIRSDRYHKGVYKDLKIRILDTQPVLSLDNDNQMTTKCQPNDNQCETEVSIGKDNIGYKEKNIKKESRFTKPTVEEVRAYCIERNNSVDAEAFVNFYESKGWLIGKNPMKDWKAAVRTWERNRDSKPNGKGMSEIDRKQRQGYTDLENYLNGHIG